MILNCWITDRSDISPKRWIGDILILRINKTQTHNATTPHTAGKDWQYERSGQWETRAARKIRTRARNKFLRNTSRRSKKRRISNRKKPHSSWSFGIGRQGDAAWDASLPRAWPSLLIWTRFRGRFLQTPIILPWLDSMTRSLGLRTRAGQLPCRWNMPVEGASISCPVFIQGRDWPKVRSPIGFRIIIRYGWSLECDIFDKIVGWGASCLHRRICISKIF